MQIVLWPRHEVFHLVIPQLSTCGKAIVPNVVFECMKLLRKVQTTDGLVTFDRFVIVAKNSLKWNDQFWDMLLVGVIYASGDSSSIDDASSARIEHISFFLILHIVEAPTRPSSPNTYQYESVWPQQIDEQGIPTSPHSGSSGAKSSPRRTIGLGSPKSSMSPKSSRPSSPKRSQFGTSRHTKPATQYLLTIRQRIALIMAALALDDVHALTDIVSTADSGGFSFSGHQGVNTDIDAIHYHLKMSNCVIGRDNLDTLSFLLGGGLSREYEISPLSALHPILASESFTSPTISYATLCVWLESNLMVNELIYPNSATYYQHHPHSSANNNNNNNPTAVGGLFSERTEIGSGCSVREVAESGSVLGHGSDISADGAFGANGATSHQHNLAPGSSNSFKSVPSRIILSESSLSKSLPTFISGFASSTCLHVVSNEPCKLSKAQSQTHGSKEKISEALNFDCVDEGIDSLALGNNNDSTKSNSNNKTKAKASRNNNASSASNEGMGAMSCISRCLDDIDNFIDEDLGEDDEEEEMANKLSHSLSHSQSTQQPSLPLLNLANCSASTIYMLGPYSNATLLGCRDCHVVIGPVSGLVSLTNCERVHLSVCCRKLSVHNCLECVFNLAALSPSIISGDSRSLVFGPYNAPYVHLAHHLERANLAALIGSSSVKAPFSGSRDEEGDEDCGHYGPAAGAVHEGSKDSWDDEGSVQGTGAITCCNMWATLCDVGLCLEAAVTVGSPSGYALDIIETCSFQSNGSSNFGQLPSPPSSTATLMTYDKFKFVCIPWRPEYQSFESSVIPLPALYHRTVLHRNDIITRAKQELHCSAASACASAVTSATAGVSTSSSSSSSSPSPAATTVADDYDEDDTARLQPHSHTPIEQSVSAKFLEWLVVNGKAQEIIDLIRMDAEKLHLTNNQSKK